MKPNPPESSVMAISTDPRKNHLLAALPDTEWQRWLLQLEWVELPLGQCCTSRAAR